MTNMNWERNNKEKLVFFEEYLDKTFQFDETEEKIQLQKILIVADEGLQNKKLMM